MFEGMGYIDWKLFYESVPILKSIDCKALAIEKLQNVKACHILVILDLFVDDIPSQTSEINKIRLPIRDIEDLETHEILYKIGRYATARPFR